jgi:hypothetical protein
MASSELLHLSWARTTELLEEARALLSPEVVQEHETVLLDIAEFLDHNELGLAFDWMKSIARESQWDSGELLKVLLLASENMGRTDDSQVLKQRIMDLT